MARLIESGALALILIAVAVSLSQLRRQEPTIPTESDYRVFESEGQWHYAVPHGAGARTEDPNGCPCRCLYLGWTSYNNMTNGMAHGITNLWQSFRLHTVHNPANISYSDINGYEDLVMRFIRDTCK